MAGERVSSGADFPPDRFPHEDPAEAPRKLLQSQTQSESVSDLEGTSEAALAHLQSPERLSGLLSITELIS